MKRTYTLIVLLGLVIGTTLTGCNKPADTTTDTSTTTTNTTETTNK